MPVNPRTSPALAELRGRKLKFVLEFMRLGENGTLAAIAAGYSERTAHVTGSQLLRDPKVAAALNEVKSKALVKVDIHQERVLSELAGLAFSDVTDYVVDESGNLAPAPGRPASVMRAVASVKRKARFYSDPATGQEVREYEVEFKLWDKPQALKLAGRHVGLFPSRDKEAIEAQAKAIVDRLIEKARQERAAAQAQADHAEDEKQRAIDVGEAPKPA